MSVTRDRNRQRVETTAKQHGMHYPSFLDEESNWQRSAQIRGLPSFLVIDKAGRVAFLHRGKLVDGSDTFEQMARVIEQALAKS